MEEEENPSKKRKSGHDFKKDREARQRGEAALSCKKIAAFFVPPPRTQSNQVISVQENDTADTGDLQQFDVSLDDNISLGGVASVSGIQDKAKIDDDFQEPSKTDFFKKPKQSELDLFFSFHPNHTKQDNPINLPFKNTVFTVSHEDGSSFKRNWLSFNERNNKLYCSVCLAFTDGSSVFCQGFDNYRHISQILGEHEKSKSHLESVKSLITFKHGRTIDKLLFEKQLDKRKKEVLQRRHVVSCAINVIKLIGKQGLAFRGKYESAHTLSDVSVNHGNFLEILLLLSEYDENLFTHIRNVTEESKVALEKRRKKAKEDKGEKPKGRGSSVTFLSKTTVTKIIAIIKNIIQHKIASEVVKAKQFSILMDTTMDISGSDQCAIVIRYLFEHEVKERILSLKAVYSTTGESLFDTLIECLKKAGLSVENCIANAFDGASNMCGQYKGVSARLKEVNPNHIHTWCYSHTLNLVITDTAQCLSQTISFFGLLNEVQVFFKESFKRLNVYQKQNPKLKLAAIGATRWRSKSDATCKIFGRFKLWYDDEVEEAVENESRNFTDKPPPYVFVELVVSLYVIGNSSEFNPNVRNTANCILNKLLSFETVVIAMMFLMVFKITTPLSDYLQLTNLDYAQAWALVSVSQRKLLEVRNSFPKVLAASNKFVTTITERIDEKLKEDPYLDAESIYMETEFPKKRSRKKNKMAGQIAEDEVVGTTEEEQFKIKVYNVVVDQLNQSMDSRFSDQKALYLDLSCFSPTRFKEIKTVFPENALNEICSLIPNLDKNKLIEELQSFATVWPQLSSTLAEIYANEDQDQDSESENSEDEEKVLKSFECKEKEQPCKSCAKCVYKVICEYNLYSLMYTELNKAYKFLLTIPLTQVSCERAFSHLKLIKTRLRYNLSNENLEAFLIMQMERETLVKIDNDEIIECLCNESQELKRLLSL